MAVCFLQKYRHDDKPQILRDPILLKPVVYVGGITFISAYFDYAEKSSAGYGLLP